MYQSSILIVGGGIAGVTAAETVRAQAPDKSVLLVSEEPHPLYSRVLLRNYVAGSLPREKVFLRSAEWYQTNGIEYAAGVRVRMLDLEDRTAELSDGRSVRYSKLLLASGGYPRPWNVPGSDVPGVLRFQTLEDADRLKDALGTAKRAVVVGGGFIAMDFVQAFVRAGIPTTLLVLAKRFWEPLLDVESADLVHDVLRASGVAVHYNAEVTRVVGTERVEGVVLRDGTEYPCDVLGVGIGIAPDHGFVHGTGVEFGIGVKVNEYLETDRPEVLAAGDAADFWDVVVGARHRLGNWTNAVLQGRAAGRTLAGTRTAFRAVSAYTIEYLGLPVAFIGDVHPHPRNRDVIRGSRAIGSVGRFVLRDGRLVGATLLNRAAERMPIQSLILRGVDLTTAIAQLANPSLPLATLAALP